MTSKQVNLGSVGASERPVTSRRNGPSRPLGIRRRVRSEYALRAHDRYRDDATLEKFHRNTAPVWRGGHRAHNGMISSGVLS